MSSSGRRRNHRLCLDANGNLLGQTRTEVGQSYSTSYGYDSVNRISQITSPGNRTVSYGRNAIGKISSVNTPVNGTATLLVGQISANALGLITNQTFANGYNESHGYNTDGQIVSASQNAATGSGTGGVGSAQVPIPNWALVVIAFVLTFISARYGKLHGKHLSMLLVFGMSLALSGLLYSAAAYAPITLHYDANGNIDQRTDGSGMATFGYDALDRLGSETGPLKTQTLNYDANGNRSGDALGSYIYLPNSNRLQTAHGQSISLDPAGNITSDGVYTYIYNQAGQITQIKQGVAVIASYFYNYQGRRTHKLTGTTTVLYHYDQAGHIISETAGNGALLKTYVWRDDAPVAIIDSSSGQDQVFYLEVDSLNTPRTARNQNGAIVWQWNSDAFGSMQPNEDPDSDSDSILTHINLRFPGQYYDQESGLFYNGARFYHPGSGRYLQSDPIGLAGGINTYTYVGGNPVNAIDPLGLRVIFEGPDNAIAKLIKEYEKLKKTNSGKMFCEKLEDSPEVYKITNKTDNFIQKGDRASYNDGFKTIVVDPNYHPKLNTVEGPRDASTTIVLGHEIGHAATGLDDGPSGERMENVNATENLIRDELKLPRRTTYP